MFDLFSIGIGPSSSHTVGPMRAARRFVTELRERGMLAETSRLRARLYGSLSATGCGHGSDVAVLLGLCGEQPEFVDVASIPDRVASIRSGRMLALDGVHEVPFIEHTDLQLRTGESLPLHPNGMSFTAFAVGESAILERNYYSVGGGFIVDEMGGDSLPQDEVPYPFASAVELLALASKYDRPISAIVLGNEQTWRTTRDIEAGLDEIWRAMSDCVRAGMAVGGTLPGGLGVRRRAAALYRRLSSLDPTDDEPRWMDWVMLYALAVNEQNAAGGRIVTAPTNGAAGIIPAVLHYYSRFVTGADEEGVRRFLLTAAAIGALFKSGASISGAEAGCQAEVGSACAMAAAGLTEVLGGTPEQVENAAEIAVEHNLGLTCDPVGGLVQIPCIERNAVAAIKAITAARLAMNSDGRHRVSLDQAIATVRETGADMSEKYKETALGGLAVNVPLC
ncbi:L-serine ammonia-lyase [Haloechinothrix salitolerans]|uniref:L-serine dehydratase n=1 Tax=Haloechinothrix salitolerans TaxID=926830 RepID=A0ABW2BWT5_9PSEU